MLTPVQESPMEGDLEEGGPSETAVHSGETSASFSHSGFRQAPHEPQSETRHGHKHHSVGEEAVREFIEINQKEASKIEHEHEPGCGIIDFYG